MDYLLRERLLIGSEAVEKLKKSHVAVFGLGGVGGIAAECLARSGIGEISVFDNDTVSVTNINRQIVADITTVGKNKTEVMKDRILNINSECRVNVFNMFYLPENADTISYENFDYVIDAVDTVTAKLTLIEHAKKHGVKIVSCMGTGGKTDPTMLKVADIKNTTVCPLAKVMRRELKKRGIEGVKVVYSTEESKIKDGEEIETKGSGRTAPPSMIFVPMSAGILLAREAVKDLTGE